MLFDYDIGYITYFDINNFSRQTNKLQIAVLEPWLIEFGLTETNINQNGFTKEIL